MEETLALKIFFEGHQWVHPPVPTTITGRELVEQVFARQPWHSLTRRLILELNHEQRKSTQPYSEEYQLATDDGFLLPNDCALGSLGLRSLDKLRIVRSGRDAVFLYGKIGNEDGKYSIEEWEVRCELAAAYRICADLNWVDTIYGHISCRVPGAADEFLICPFGLLFSEVTASSLLKVKISEKGEIVDNGNTKFGYNRAGFVIHSTILKARPELNCVLHTHSISGVAVACMKEGLLPISQTSFVFGDVSYHDYEGIAVSDDERERLVRDLGTTNRVMILKNHGLLTAGLTIGEAFFHYYMLNDACAIQVTALSAGKDNVYFPPDFIRQRTKRIAFDFNPEGIGIKEFAALRRELDKRDRSYMN